MNSVSSPGFISQSDLSDAHLSTLDVRVPTDYGAFHLLDVVRISRMSQWDRPPPGSKRRSDFTDSGRPGSYQVSFPRHSHTSQSPEVSTSPHSYQEGQTPKTVRQSSFPTAGSASSSNVVGRRIDASFYASSSTMRRPNPLSTSATELTLPPIAHPSPTPARLTQGSGDLSPKFGADTLILKHYCARVTIFLLPMLKLKSI